MAISIREEIKYIEKGICTSDYSGKELSLRPLATYDLDSNRRVHVFFLSDPIKLNGKDIHKVALMEYNPGLSGSATLYEFDGAYDHTIVLAPFNFPNKKNSRDAFDREMEKFDPLKKQFKGLNNGQSSVTIKQARYN